MIHFLHVAWCQKKVCTLESDSLCKDVFGHFSSKFYIFRAQTQKPNIPYLIYILSFSFKILLIVLKLKMQWWGFLWKMSCHFCFDSSWKKNSMRRIVWCEAWRDVCLILIYPVVTFTPQKISAYQTERLGHKHQGQVLGDKHMAGKDF